MNYFSNKPEVIEMSEQQLFSYTHSIKYIRKKHERIGMSLPEKERPKPAAAFSMLSYYFHFLLFNIILFIFFQVSVSISISTLTLSGFVVIVNQVACFYRVEVEEGFFLYCSQLHVLISRFLVKICSSLNTIET